MKRLSGLLALVFLATPVFAQDVDFGAFSDTPTLAPIAPTRGAAPARGAVPPAPPPVDRLVRLRDVLLKAEAPLTKDQEAALNALINAEIPVMRKTIQTHGQEMIAARPPSAPPAGPAGAAAPGPAAGAGPAPGATVPPTRGAVPITAPAPAGAPTPNPAQAAALAQAQAAAAARGGGALPPGGAPSPALLAAMAAARGASPSSRVPAEVLDALEVEMRAMNDALFIKIASAPALDAKQQGVLTKMSRDQMKARGGFDALRISMEDAKAPFTDEQTPKVQALFEDQKKSRAELAKESQGTPDPAKLKALERETLTKVVGILTPAQRTALLAVLRAAQ